MPACPPKKNKKKPTYLPNPNSTGSVTANQQFFKDGLEYLLVMFHIILIQGDAIYIIIYLTQLFEAF